MKELLTHNEYIQRRTECINNTIKSFELRRKEYYKNGGTRNISDDEVIFNVRSALDRFDADYGIRIAKEDE